MTPIFHFRGYTAVDPIDNAPPAMRYVLGMLVTSLLTVALILVISDTSVYFASFAVKVQEVVLFGVFYACIIIFLRKSSTIVLFLVVLIPLVILDIYLEAHFRAVGETALWMYVPTHVVHDISPPLWRSVVTQAVDALLIGPVCIWLTRLVAGLIYGWKSGEPTKEHRAKLFPPEWTHESVSKPKRDIGYWILRLLGFGYLSYLILLVVGAFGASPFPAQAADLISMTYSNPALAMNTFGKVGVMVLLAFAGAYNVKLRYHATLAMAVGHLISTVGSLYFYFINPDKTDPVVQFLLTSAIVDGVMVALFVFIMIRTRSYASAFASAPAFPAFFSLPAFTSKWFFYIITAVSWAMVVGAVYFRHAEWSGPFSAVYGSPDPILTNTMTCYGTVGFIALLLATRERLRDYFTGILLFPLSVGALACGLWYIFQSHVSVPIPDRFPEIIAERGASIAFDQYFMVYAIGNLIAILAIGGFRRMYYKVEYLITSLQPSDARNVMGVYEALYGGTPRDAALALQRIDRFAGDIRGRLRGLVNFPFWIVENIFPLFFGLHPMYSSMSREERRYFLRKYVMRTPDEQRRAFVPALASMAFKIGTSVYALAAFAHYSTIRTWERIGYLLPDARERLQPDVPTHAPDQVAPAALPMDENDARNFAPPVQPDAPRPVARRVVTPIGEPDIPDEVDYIVIGSGAGGAMAAYRLAQQVADPSKILVVERGGRYSPLQDMNDNELEMIPKLYKEGGLQQTKNFDMMVLQGEAVGGTTVINNAVCFEMGPLARKDWSENFGIDLSTIDDEYRVIERELGIAPLPEHALNANTRRLFLRGVDGYNANAANAELLDIHNPLRVNGRYPAGDGLWNLGNKRMHKRSMLESYIPWAEARGVKVVPNTSAVRYISDSHGRAESVMLRSNTGDLRTVKVNKAVVLAGGCIASSHFLMRSGVTGEVGQHLACNFAFPVAFDFDEVLNAFDGNQITVGAFDRRERAIFETYFNPPAAFALSLPFFFERTERLMERYRNSVNFGALAGSEPNGIIHRKANPVSGRPFTWTLGERDREHIRYALTTLAHIGMHAGATRMFVPSRPGIELPLTPGNISRFSEALDQYPLRLDDVVMTTAHPQGGNRMAARGGVVDTKFNVRGTTNVFVADASVFPSSIGVNPQHTIMALASMSAKEVLKL